MQLALTAKDKPINVGNSCASNLRALEHLPKPSYWDSERQAKALGHFNAAKNFALQLKQWEERLSHTGTLLRVILHEMDEFVDQCRTLDQQQRKFLKELFSASVIHFQTAPQIGDQTLNTALRDRLQTRWRYLEQLLAELRSYNDVVRHIQQYFAQNASESFFSGSHIEGFIQQSELPQEIKVG